MSDQGTRLFFLIQLIFSDSQAKKFVGKEWIILPLTKFYADFFSYNKVIKDSWYMKCT